MFDDCFECGQEAHHLHHVVPRSRGGTNTVPLCITCHGLAHDANMKNLIKDGKPSSRTGRLTADVQEKILTLRLMDNMSVVEISAFLGVPSRTVQRYLSNHVKDLPPLPRGRRSKSFL